MSRLPWVRLVLGAVLLVLGLVLARRTIVRCAKQDGTCLYGDQRFFGGDVRTVRIDDVERITLDRVMNREGERRSQAILLMKSGGRVPATPMDERDKNEIVTAFAAVQSGDRADFVEWYAGPLAWAGALFGAAGAVLLGLAAAAIVRRRRAITSSR